jgi:hypothetical protein
MLSQKIYFTASNHLLDRTVLQIFIEFMEIYQYYLITGKGNLQMIKKTPHFVLNFFANFHSFASFSQAHAGTLQNHSISPHANTVLNNTVK